MCLNSRYELEPQKRIGFRFSLWSPCKTNPKGTELEQEKHHALACASSFSAEDVNLAEMPHFFVAPVPWGDGGDVVPKLGVSSKGSFGIEPTHSLQKTHICIEVIPHFLLRTSKFPLKSVS